MMSMFAKKRFPSRMSRLFPIAVAGLGFVTALSSSSAFAQRGFFRGHTQSSVPNQRFATNSAPAHLVVTTNQDAWEFQAMAESAIESERYEQAARTVARATEKDSENGMLHLFASHVFFAIADYEQAARELDLATDLMPDTDWHRIYHQISWIDNRKNYASQVNRLVAYIKQNPTSIDAQVVFGFHAAVRGKPDLAKTHLDWVLSAQADHALAGRLIHSFGQQKHQSVKVGSQRLGGRAGTIGLGTGLVNGSGGRLGS